MAETELTANQAATALEELLAEYDVNFVSQFLASRAEEFRIWRKTEAAIEGVDKLFKLEIVGLRDMAKYKRQLGEDIAALEAKKIQAQAELTPARQALAEMQQQIKAAKAERVREAEAFAREEEERERIRSAFAAEAQKLGSLVKDFAGVQAKGI